MVSTMKSIEYSKYIVDNTNKNHEKTINDYKTKLIESDNIIDKLRDNNNQLMKQISELNTTIDVINRNNNTNNNTNEILQDKINNYKEYIEKLENEINDLKNNNNIINNNIKKIENDNNNLKNEILILINEKDDYSKNWLKKLNDQKNDFDANYNNTKVKYDIILKELNEKLKEQIEGRRIDNDNYNTILLQKSGYYKNLMISVMTALREIKIQVITEQSNMKDLLKFITNYQYKQDNINNNNIINTNLSNKDIKVLLKNISVIFHRNGKTIQQLEDIKNHSYDREVSFYNDKRLISKSLEESNQKLNKLTELVEVLKEREAEARRLLHLANEELKKLRKVV